MSGPSNMGHSTEDYVVPRAGAMRVEWYGVDEGGTWRLEVESDCFTAGEPFVVSVYVKSDDIEEGSMAALTPSQARELAGVMLRAADNAEVNSRQAKGLAMPLELDRHERMAVRRGDVLWAQVIRNFLDENPNAEADDLVQMIWEMIEPVTGNEVGSHGAIYRAPLTSLIDDRRDEFVDMYREGASLARMAKVFNVPIAVIALAASALRADGESLPGRLRPHHPLADD